MGRRLRGRGYPKIAAFVKPSTAAANDSQPVQPVAALGNALARSRVLSLKLPLARLQVTRRGGGGGRLK